MRLPGIGCTSARPIPPIEQSFGFSPGAKSPDQPGARYLVQFVFVCCVIRTRASSRQGPGSMIVQSRLDCVYGVFGVFQVDAIILTIKFDGVDLFAGTEKCLD